MIHLIHAPSPYSPSLLRVSLQEYTRANESLQALNPRTHAMFNLHPQLFHSHIVRAVVFPRIEPAWDHDRRAIQHSVVQPTLGFITELR